VRLDAAQRVDSVPPLGLRLLLLRQLLERAGGPAAPPLPPNPVLLLRGPGVWDQLDLRPVLDQAARVQAAFADELSSRPGLQDPSGIERQARTLLEEVEVTAPTRRPEARVLFSALGLTATQPGAAERIQRLLDSLGDSQRPGAVPQTPARRRAPSRRRASRSRILADAIRLGSAFGGGRTQAFTGRQA